MDGHKKRADSNEREKLELREELEKARMEVEDSCQQLDAVREKEREARQSLREALQREREARSELESALQNADDAREISKRLQNRVAFLTDRLNGRPAPKEGRTVSNERSFIEDDGDHSDDPDYEPASDSSSEEALVAKNTCGCEHGFNRGVCGNEDAANKTTVWVADLEKLCPCRKNLKH